MGLLTRSGTLNYVGRAREDRFRVVLPANLDEEYENNENNTWECRMKPVVLAVLVLPLALAACREEEQDRPLSHTPGVYLGVEDQKLTEEEVRALQQRADGQNF